MTHDNHIWVLMSRLLSGEASPEEREELQRLLEQSPQRQYLFDILHSYFTDLPATASVRPAEDSGMEERFRKVVDQSPAFRPRAAFSFSGGASLRLPVRKRWMVAAAIAACLLLGWGIYRLAPVQTPPPPAARNNIRSEEVLARAGARTKLLLPDGTQVWLNSNSRLKYTSEFNSKNREVALEGEAYFDVTMDAHRPFIVHASALDVKVLGTVFTIKSYPQDETIEATLLKGMIEVSRKDNPSTPRIILKPNEKLVFSKRSPALLQTGSTSDAANIRAPATTPDIAVNPIRKDIPDSDKVETAWMYNRLVFNGDNFKELAAKMERWYNVRILIRDTSLNSYRFGGIFEKETIGEALEELQLTREFIYKISGNEIELYAKE